MKIKFNSFNLLAFVFLFSCSEDFVPKPKGYNRIDLPKHQYQLLQEKHPYQFEYSKFATILKDSSALSEPHWIDIWYPDYKANIQITYKNFKNNNDKFDELVVDAHKLASKHQVKAYSIEEGVFKTKNGYAATIFELSGEVPSQFQFYVTDSSSNFLRGALYFRTSTKNDSLAPIIEYMKKDITHIMNTLKWQSISE